MTSNTSFHQSFLSFTQFCEAFPLLDDAVYLEIFKHHGHIIRTQKAKFAVTNLKKLFTATFAISSQSGFDKMSLRELSTQAQMSMGAIYSCIERKEDIAVMVSNVVKSSGHYIVKNIPADCAVQEAIQMGILYQLYTSTVLRSWYFFLYFETRTLPAVERKASMELEVNTINFFEKLIKKGIEQRIFDVENPRAIANMIVVMLEDWYLKPWKHDTSKNRGKYGYSQKALENYYYELLQLLAPLLQPKFC